MGGANVYRDTSPPHLPARERGRMGFSHSRPKCDAAAVPQNVMFSVLAPELITLPAAVTRFAKVVCKSGLLTEC
jgi:hypothetical protein